MQWQGVGDWASGLWQGAAKQLPDEPRVRARVQAKLGRVSSLERPSLPARYG
ncbi:MAG TPA: hypothetical protein VEZ88_06860 [Steroidobacteraceae bacterium]|nr:hypothetical protein [Steroidobacteraceae bacterium]